MLAIGEEANPNSMDPIGSGLWVCCLPVSASCKQANAAIQRPRLTLPQATFGQLAPLWRTFAGDRKLLLLQHSKQPPQWRNRAKCGTCARFSNTCTFTTTDSQLELIPIRFLSLSLELASTCSGGAGGNRWHPGDANKKPQLLRIEASKPNGTMFLWAPKEEASSAFSRRGYCCFHYFLSLSPTCLLLLLLLALLLPALLGNWANPAAAAYSLEGWPQICIISVEQASQVELSGSQQPLRQNSEEVRGKEGWSLDGLPCRLSLALLLARFSLQEAATG